MKLIKAFLILACTLFLVQSANAQKLAGKKQVLQTITPANNYFIIDAWKGMEIYPSDDLLNWKKQAKRILENPGKGLDDQAIGGHCDVMLNNGRAFVFYFTQPGHRKDKPAARGSFNDKRSVIQLAESK